MMKIEKITLTTPSMQGEIYVGNGVLETRLPSLLRGQKNFVLTDTNVYALYPQLFEKYFAQAALFVIPAGEESKTFAVLGEILKSMSDAGLHRTSRLFAVGGGVIGDIGGLAAALYMRGISCVQIPTTLLSQVDSSVGGKTAVDHSGVKNIVGAFYQPCEVLVEPDFLKTLPPREIKCGVGEIVKYAALSGEIFDALSNNVNRLSDLCFLTQMLCPCIRHKARVVEADEKESGLRQSLNVGHTTGHAIELSHNLSHGESVLYGMKLETLAAIEAGVCEQSHGEALLAIIQSALALTPHTHPDFSQIDKDAEKAKADKKNVGDGNIKMAVAKAYGQWCGFCLPFDEYTAALIRASKQ